MVRNRGADPDDDASLITTSAERPLNRNNLVASIIGQGKTPPPRFGVPQGFEPRNLTDGFFGNDRGWADEWFQLKLRSKATLGRFRFGRDRTGVLSDRCADYMKIETSLDGKTWQTVFEQDKLTQLPGFSPAKTVEIQIAPVQAEYLKVTMVPPGKKVEPLACIDEFEVYAPAAHPPAKLPQVVVLDRPEVWRPTRHTTLQVEAAPVRLEGEQEVLELRLKNTGPMTAFFCEVHPLISYRTDLFIDNNHCFVPPGESRTITIRGSDPLARGRGAGGRACGLSLRRPAGGSPAGMPSRSRSHPARMCSWPSGVATGCAASTWGISTREDRGRETDDAGRHASRSVAVALSA